MPLAEHLREFRNRLFISLCAVVLGSIVGWIYYQELLDLLQEPLDATIAELERESDVDIRAVINSVAGSFLLQVKVALTAGVVLASPVWLYQLWAFIMPGLHRRERKWTIIFVAIAGPLFVAGVLLGYYVLPKGLTVLLGFTPEDVSNLIDVREYLNFVLRILIVFGISFELPLFVVMLNLAGVVRARQLARWRSWIIFATFVFAAVATPSTDPVTMLLLAIPVTALFLVSEQIARFVDRRRGLDGEPDYDRFDDEAASPL